MKTVFRYEHQYNPILKYGIGPYQSEWKYNSMLCDSHSDDLFYPTIGVDILNRDKIGGTTLCGCESLEKLKMWFIEYDFNSKLVQNGFELVKYTVSELMETKSGKQVAFDPSHIIEREVL